MKEKTRRPLSRMERCDKVMPECGVTTSQRSHSDQQEQEEKNGIGEHMWQGSQGEASQGLEI